jgi:hypothetical protein
MIAALAHGEDRHRLQVGLARSGAVNGADAEDFVKILEDRSVARSDRDREDESQPKRSVGERLSPTTNTEVSLTGDEPSEEPP